jgi:hypothetical protein
MSIQCARGHEGSVKELGSICAKCYVITHEELAAAKSKLSAQSLALAEAVKVLEEIAANECCAAYVNGCPRHQIVGDRRGSCATTKAKNALEDLLARLRSQEKPHD